MQSKKNEISNFPNFDHGWSDSRAELGHWCTTVEFHDWLVVQMSFHSNHSPIAYTAVPLSYAVVRAMKDLIIEKRSHNRKIS